MFPDSVPFHVRGAEEMEADEERLMTAVAAEREMWIEGLGRRGE